MTDGKTFEPGLALSERFFREKGLPFLQKKYPEYLDCLAAGLVGDGSQCFGYDDEISMDHDWCAGFYVWLSDEDMTSAGDKIQSGYQQLIDNRTDSGERLFTQYGSMPRVMAANSFYKQYTGCCGIPESLKRWLEIPQWRLALATNGKVFFDGNGKFTAIREGLLAYYPEDVRMKKIGSECMWMGHYGQYNYPRCIQRQEYVAAGYALFRFIESAISIIFLLNQKYKPYYKWMHRALRELPILGRETYSLLGKLSYPADAESPFQKNKRIIEEICSAVVEQLKVQGLTDLDEDFMLPHGEAINQRIKDDGIRSHPLLVNWEAI